MRIADLGALPVHRGRIVRAWLKGKPLDTGTRREPTENFLPLAMRKALPQITEELDALARIHTQHPAADGSARLLVALADGQMVERVLPAPRRCAHRRDRALPAQSRRADQGTQQCRPGFRWWLWPAAGFAITLVNTG